jgi:hypothetical protein
MLDVERAAARTKSRRIAAAAALVAALAVHVALAAYFLDFKLVFEPAPLGSDDFNTHYAQTWRVIEGLSHWGKTWVYDVKLLAGQPEGTIFDADNKGWSLITYALTRAGVAQPVAFNLFIALVMLGAPFAVFGGARLFGYGVGAAACAGALASMLWFFDSFVHWAWWVGMVSYSGAAYLALIPLGLFYRFERTRKLGYALACAPVLGVQHLIHPYSFFILAPPMAALYARGFRSFTRKEHAAVVAVGAVTVGINARWLLDAIHHWHYILNSAYFAQARFSSLATDFLGILRDTSDTGVIGTRTGFRYLCLALGACGLWRLRSRRDPRFLPLAVACGALFTLAYCGWVPGSGQVQPYRHVIPLGFMAALPAGDFLWQWLSGDLARQASGATRAVLAIAALIGVQHLLSDALYFMPTLLSKPAQMIDRVDSPLSPYGFPYLFAPDVPVFEYRIPSLPFVEEGLTAIEDWFVAHAKPGERILIDSPALGERMAWRMPFEVIGGFRQRNLAHSYANMFRDEGKRWTPRQLAEYLRTFSIGWIVAYVPRPYFEDAKDVLERVAEIHGVRIYRTRFPVGKVLGGTGAVRARTNRIEVRDSDPNAPLLLSYHFHEALRCKPNCRVERARVPLDRVGFIKVPAPHPKDVVIWNSYQ